LTGTIQKIDRSGTALWIALSEGCKSPSNLFLSLWNQSLPRFIYLLFSSIPLSICQLSK
jgi:hypothetical protein